MMSLQMRLAFVFEHAWSVLPDIKQEAQIAAVCLEDLGAMHGSYNADTCVLTLNEQLFWGETPADIMMIDIRGQSPPRQEPFVSRALHTCIHELCHAIGTATGLDESQEWLALSGWCKDANDPRGTARYTERRPGWEWGISDWRYRTGGTWFAREYSTKSPFEDFADTCTHLALGWPIFQNASGHAKAQFLRRHVWRQTTQKALHAAQQVWRKLLTHQGVW